MSTRESLAQARDNLDRARSEADARFNEWAALLAKEAAEDALRLVAHEEGNATPDTDSVQPLVPAALGDIPHDHPVRQAAARIDELYDPVEVDLETATPAQKEGGNPDYLRQEETREFIELAERIVDACQERLDA